MKHLAGILLAALLALPAAAAAEHPAAALLLFLDAESEAAGLPAPPAVLREAAQQSLVAALAAPGRRICAGENIDHRLAAARVRSARGLTADLLADLRAHCGAEQVIVARLACCRGRLFLTLRGIAAEDGRLLQVAVAERELGLGDDWRRVLGDMALELAAGWHEPAPAAADAAGLLVLPARGAGAEPLLLSLIEELLLVELLAQGQWRILDPALLVGELRGQGIHPAALGGTARRALAAGQGASALLRLSVIADAAEGGGGPGARQGAPPLLLEDDDGEIGFGAGAAAARAAGQPLYATLAWVDPERGLLRRLAECYLPAEAATASFGRPRRSSWIERSLELTRPLAAAPLDTTRPAAPGAGAAH